MNSAYLRGETKLLWSPLEWTSLIAWLHYCSTDPIHLQRIATHGDRRGEINNLFTCIYWIENSLKSYFRLFLFKCTPTHQLLPPSYEKTLMTGYYSNRLTFLITVSQHILGPKSWNSALSCYMLLILKKCFCFVCTEILDKTERLYELKEIVKKFHPVNYEVLKYVITHLNRYFLCQISITDKQLH